MVGCRIYCSCVNHMLAHCCSAFFPFAVFVPAVSSCRGQLTYLLSISLAPPVTSPRPAPKRSCLLHIVGEDHPYCKALIEAHKQCLRLEGFNVSIFARVSAPAFDDMDMLFVTNDATFHTLPLLNVLTRLLYARTLRRFNINQIYEEGVFFLRILHRGRSCT